MSFTLAPRNVKLLPTREAAYKAYYLASERLIGALIWQVEAEGGRLDDTIYNGDEYRDYINAKNYIK